MVTFSIKTFGCRLNRAESAKFEAVLQAAGLQEMPFNQNTDIIILHTCAITANAEHECMRVIHSVRKAHPSSLLVVAGCAVEAGEQKRMEELGVDLIIPREEKNLLPEKILTRFHIPIPEGNIPPAETLSRAALKVQDGCSFFCTYCIVPYTRGKPKSRPFDECICEAREFSKTGFQEIVVTGCNIACYVDHGKRFPDLIRALVQLPEVGRIRIGSLEPGINEREIIRMMQEEKKLCRFLHLPIQSGDSEILKRMGRHYSAKELRETLDELVERVPMAGLGADIITGFPGETEEAFQHTVELVEQYPFSNLHVFPYSERPGTPAVSYECSIPIHERKERTKELLAVRQKKREAFAQQWIGKEAEVLLEKFHEDNTASGWSGEYLPCTVQGAEEGDLRKLIRVKVLRADGEHLFCKKEGEVE